MIFLKKNRTFVLGMICSLMIFGMFFSYAHVHAAATDTFGIQEVNQNINLGSQDIRVTVVKIINTVLGLLGILTLVLMLYAGFMYMTAGGNEEKVAQARKIIVNATIGLVIILSAWGITKFILGRLIAATGAGNNVPSCVGEDCNRPCDPTIPGACDKICSEHPEYSICRDLAFYVKSITPSTPRGATGMNNIVIRVLFSQPLDPTRTRLSEAVVAKDSSNSNLPLSLTLTHDNYVIEGVYQGDIQHVAIGTYTVTVNQNNVRDSRGRELITSYVSNGHTYPSHTTFVVDQAFDDVQAPVIDPISMNGQTSNVSMYYDEDFVVSSTIHDFVSGAYPHGGVGLVISSIAPESDPSNFIQSYTYRTGPLVGDGSSADFDFSYGWRLYRRYFEAGKIYIFKITAYDVDHNSSERILIFEMRGERGGEGDSCRVDNDCQWWLKCMNQVCTKWPIITEVDPMDGASGNWVTILGRNFGEATGTIQFMYDSNGDNILDASETATLAACREDVWHDSWVVAEVPSIVRSSAVGNKALHFNAGTSTVFIADTDEKLTPSNITVELWIRPDNFDQQINLIRKNSNGGYTLRQNNNQLLWVVGGVTAQATIASPNVWVHVVATYNGATPENGEIPAGGGTASLYINGNQVSEKKGGVQIVPDSAEIYLGKAVTNDKPNYRGSLDELSVYERVLTAQEVSGHFAASQKNVGDYTNMVKGDGSLVSYWRFSEASSTPSIANEKELSPIKIDGSMAEFGFGFAGPMSSGSSTDIVSRIRITPAQQTYPDYFDDSDDTFGPNRTSGAPGLFTVNNIKRPGLCSVTVSETKTFTNADGSQAVISKGSIAAPPAVAIQAEGKAFGSVKGVLDFGGATSTRASISSWGDLIIKSSVPYLQAGTMGVRAITSSNEKSNKVPFTVLSLEQLFAPSISLIDPASTTPGSYITISGNHFGSVPGSVYFSSKKNDSCDSGCVVSAELPAYCSGYWRDDQVIVKIPEDIVQRLNATGTGSFTTTTYDVLQLAGLSHEPGFVYDYFIGDVPHVKSFQDVEGKASLVENSELDTYFYYDNLSNTDANFVQSGANNIWTGARFVISKGLQNNEQGSYAMSIFETQTMNNGSFETVRSLRFSYIDTAGITKTIDADLPENTTIIHAKVVATTDKKILLYAGYDSDNSLENIERGIALPLRGSETVNGFAVNTSLAMLGNGHFSTASSSLLGGSLQGLSITRKERVRTGEGLNAFVVVKRGDSNLKSDGSDGLTIVDGPPAPSICSLQPDHGAAPLPANQYLTLKGDNFSVNPSAYFWSQNASAQDISLSSWLTVSSIGLNEKNNTLVKTVIPSDSEHGFTMVTGPIKIKNDQGVPSNGVTYTVDNCNVPNAPQIPNFHCCTEGPEMGRWKHDDVACEGEKREAGYMWRFTSGIIADVPYVVEECNQVDWNNDNVGIKYPSPTPWKDAEGIRKRGDQVCLNADVAVRFSTGMDNATLNSRTVELFKCNTSTEENAYLDPQDLPDTDALRCEQIPLDPNRGDLAYESGVLVIRRGGSSLDKRLEPNTWYHVQLSKDISSLFTSHVTNATTSLALRPTRPCTSDTSSTTAFCFNFKTASANNLCTLVAADMNPIRWITKILGVVQDDRFSYIYDLARVFNPGSVKPQFYFVNGRGNQECVMIDVDEYPWEWGPTSTAAATGHKYPDNPRNGLYQNKRGIAKAWRNFPAGKDIYAFTDQANVVEKVIDLRQNLGLSSDASVVVATSTDARVVDDPNGLFAFVNSSTIHIDFEIDDINTSTAPFVGPRSDGQGVYWEYQRFVASKGYQREGISALPGSYFVMVREKVYSTSTQRSIVFYFINSKDGPGKSAAYRLNPEEKRVDMQINVNHDGTYLRLTTDVNGRTDRSAYSVTAEQLESFRSVMPSPLVLGKWYVDSPRNILFGKINNLTVTRVFESNRVTATSTLFIVLDEPKAIELWPKCTEACINSEIGALFDQIMDTTTFKAENIKLYKCQDEFCGSVDSEVPLEVKPDGFTDNKIVAYPAHSQYLEQNTWYKAELLSGIKAVAGVNEDGSVIRGGNAQSLATTTWKFKTKNDPKPCLVHDIGFNPNPFIATYIGQQTNYSLTAKGSPDACTSFGQRLNPWDYGWSWNSENYKIATTTHFELAGSVKRGCTMGCKLWGSFVSRLDNETHPVFVRMCGNGKLDSGEDCDIGMGGEVLGQSCTIDCLRPGNSNFASATSTEDIGKCGDGHVSSTLGEECDVGSTIRQYCADNCTWRGSLQSPPEGQLDVSWCGGIPAAVTAGEECETTLTTTTNPFGDLWNLNELKYGCSNQCLHTGSLLAQSWCDQHSSEVSASSTLSDLCNKKAVSVCGNNIIETGEECEITGVHAVTLVTGERITITSPTSICSDFCVLKNICDTSVPAELKCTRGSAGCNEDCTLLGSSIYYGTPSLCGDSVVGIGEYARCEVPTSSKTLGQGPVQRVTAVGEEASSTLFNSLTNSFDTHILADAIAFRNASGTAESMTPVRGSGDYSLQCGYTEFGATHTTDALILHDDVFFLNPVNTSTYVSVDVLANDGQNLTITNIAQPGSPLVFVPGNQTERNLMRVTENGNKISGIQPAEFQGIVTTTYTAQSRDGRVAQAHLTFVIAGPEFGGGIDGGIQPDFVTTSVGREIFVDVLANDQGGPYELISFGNPVTVVGNYPSALKAEIQSKRIKITPRFGFSGTSLVRYEVRGTEEKTTSTAYIAVVIEQDPTPVLDVPSIPDTNIQNDCPQNDDNHLGVGSTSCCYDRPQRMAEYPVRNAGSSGSQTVCRNTYIEATFDREIKETSLKNNAMLVQGISNGAYDCATHGGTDVTSLMFAYAQDREGNSGFWQHMWGGIKKFMIRLLGLDAYAVDGTLVRNQIPPEVVKWCTSNVSLNPVMRTITSADGRTAISVASLYISNALEPDAYYAVLLKGGIDGIQDIRGVGIKNIETTSRNDFWLFKTSGEICKIDHVNANPSHALFKTATESHTFTAQVISKVAGQQIVRTPAYNWVYSWHPAENPVFNIPADGASADAEQIDVTSKGVEGHINAVLQAKVTFDIDEKNNQYGKIFPGPFDLRAFFCVNPWPPENLNISNTSLRNSVYNDDVFNFSMSYCADAGNAVTTTDDLPYLGVTDVLASGEIGAPTMTPDVISKKMFFNPKNDDAIGVQIFKNEPKNGKRQTVEQWYMDKFGSLGSMRATMVGEYEALTDGSNYYVNAMNFNPNIGSLGLIYNNIYLFGVNQNAQSETRQVFEKLLKSLQFNTNISDYGLCLLKDQDGQTFDVRNTPDSVSDVACTTDFDCHDTEGLAKASTTAWSYDTNGTCSNAKTKFWRDWQRIHDIGSAQTRLDTYFTGNTYTPNFKGDLLGGTYIPGYTNSRWPSWGYLGTLANGVPLDPINQWIGCSGQDPQTCWDATSSTFKCPSFAQVYEYEFVSSTRNYKIHGPLEFFTVEDPILGEFINLDRFTTERWCDGGEILSPFGGVCGDGVVNPLKEECDPPFGSVVSTFGRLPATRGTCADEYNVSRDRIDPSTKKIGCASNVDCGLYTLVEGDKKIFTDKPGICTIDGDPFVDFVEKVSGPGSLSLNTLYGMGCTENADCLKESTYTSRLSHSDCGGRDCQRLAVFSVIDSKGAQLQEFPLEDLSSLARSKTIACTPLTRLKYTVVAPPPERGLPAITPIVHVACDGAAPSGIGSCGSNGEYATKSCTNQCAWEYGMCKSDSSCGNGIVEGAEKCDDGELNGTYGHCNRSCNGLFSQSCGNYASTTYTPTIGFNAQYQMPNWKYGIVDKTAGRPLEFCEFTKELPSNERKVSVVRGAANNWVLNYACGQTVVGLNAKASSFINMLHDLHTNVFEIDANNIFVSRLIRQTWGFGVFTPPADSFVGCEYRNQKLPLQACAGSEDCGAIMRLSIDGVTTSVFVDNFTHKVCAKGDQIIYEGYSPLGIQVKNAFGCSTDTECKSVAIYESKAKVMPDGAQHISFKSGTPLAGRTIDIHGSSFGTYIQNKSDVTCKDFSSQLLDSMGKVKIHLPVDCNCGTTDSDNDGVYDLCDNCSSFPNGGQEDQDGDTVGDACDNCPAVANTEQTDSDEDGRGGVCDNCPTTKNQSQADYNNDGVGNACDQTLVTILNSLYGLVYGGADLDTQLRNGEGLLCENHVGYCSNAPNYVCNTDAQCQINTSSPSTDQYNQAIGAFNDALSGLLDLTTPSAIQQAFNNATSTIGALYATLGPVNSTGRCIPSVRTYNVNKEYSCSWDCQSYGGYCGDKIIQRPQEDCDDGNADDNDICTNGCKFKENPSICGNGSLEAGEECDDSNINNGDGCTSKCKTEPRAPQTCGNGEIDTNLGEICDKGTQNGVKCVPGYEQPCSYCSDDCTKIISVDPVAFCGNGKVDWDDRNPNGSRDYYLEGVRRILEPYLEVCDTDPVTNKVYAPWHIVTSTPTSRDLEVTCSNRAGLTLYKPYNEFRGSLFCTSTVGSANVVAKGCQLINTSGCFECGVSEGGPIPKAAILNVTTGNTESQTWGNSTLKMLVRKSISITNGLETHDISPQYFTGALGSRTLIPHTNGTPETYGNFSGFVSSGSNLIHINSNEQCKDFYSLQFVKSSPPGTSPMTFVADKRDIATFDYPIKGTEATEINNEYVVSPAVPTNTIRVVVRWTNETKNFNGYEGTTFALNVVKGNDHGNNISYNGVSTRRGICYSPDFKHMCTDFQGVYMHPIGNLQKNYAQAVTLDVQDDSLGSTYAFYVSNADIVDGQPLYMRSFTTPDSDVTVEVYEPIPGQIEGLPYKPTKVFALKDIFAETEEKIPSRNTPSPYWHVFNFVRTASGKYEIRAVNKRDTESGVVTGLYANGTITSEENIKNNMPAPEYNGPVVVPEGYTPLTSQYPYNSTGYRTTIFSQFGGSVLERLNSRDMMVALTGAPDYLFLYGHQLPGWDWDGFGTLLDGDDGKFTFGVNNCDAADPTAGCYNYITGASTKTIIKSHINGVLGHTPSSRAYDFFPLEKNIDYRYVVTYNEQEDDQTTRGFDHLFRLFPTTTLSLVFGFGDPNNSNLQLVPFSGIFNKQYMLDRVGSDHGTGANKWYVFKARRRDDGVILIDIIDKILSTSITKGEFDRFDN